MKQVRWSFAVPLLLAMCLILARPANAATYRFLMRKPITTSSADLTSEQLDALTNAGISILEDYGPFAIVEGPQADVTALRDLTGLAFDPDDDAFRVELAGISIDTRAGAAPPVLDTDLRLDDYAESTGLYVLQFRGPLRAGWLELLSNANVRAIQYMGAHSYVVAAPRGLAALKALFDAPVQYVGVMQPAFKLAPVIRALTPSSHAVMPMAALLDGGQDLSSTIALLSAIDSATDTPTGVNGGQQLVHFLATASQARMIARAATVLWIEPVPDKGLSDERADEILLGNISGGQPTGAGTYATTLSNSYGLGTTVLSTEIVDVQDSGIELSGVTNNYSLTCITPTSANVGHPDLNNASTFARLVYACPSSPQDNANVVDGLGHGTLAASIIAANPSQTGGAATYFTPADNPKDSSAFFWSTGVAPGVRFGSTKLFTDTGGMFPMQLPYPTLAATAYGQGARYMNASWNLFNADTYSSTTAAYDAIVRNAGSTDFTHEMTVVVSAGNIPRGGTPTQDPAIAKNVITVGASGILRTNAEVGTCVSAVGLGDVSSFSSRGASYNVHLYKPDLVAPGQVMVGALSKMNYSGLNDCYSSVTALPDTGQDNAPHRGLYFPGQGTSYSAPQATAAAVLVKKVLQATIPSVIAAPSMIKAILVANAESMHGGLDHSIGGTTLGWEPTAVQGWGRLSLKRFFDGTPRMYSSENASFKFTATGQSQYFNLTVSDPTKAVLVSLAWTDPPGGVGLANPLVNSIGLYVYAGANIYCDGAGYYGGQYHTPQNVCFLAPDQVNNVKMIRIAPNTFSSGGTFTVQMYALGINGTIPPPGIPSGQDWSAYVYNAH